MFDINQRIISVHMSIISSIQPHWIGQNRLRKEVEQIEPWIRSKKMFGRGIGQLDLTNQVTQVSHEKFLIDLNTVYFGVGSQNGVSAECRMSW